MFVFSNDFSMQNSVKIHGSGIGINTPGEKAHGENQMIEWQQKSQGPMWRCVITLPYLRGLSSVVFSHWLVSDLWGGAEASCFLTLCLRKYPCCSKVVLFLRSCHRVGPCCDRSVEECTKRGVFASATTKRKHDSQTIPTFDTYLEHILTLHSDGMQLRNIYPITLLSTF